MAEKVEETVEETVDTQGAGESEQPIENTVSLKKFKSVWSEKQKLKDELAVYEAKMSDYETKVQNYTSKLEEYRGIDEKLKKWEADRLADKTNEWLEKSKVLNINEGDKGFEKINKIKEKFVFGSEEKPLTSEDIDKNNELFSIYSDANYFDVIEITDNTHKEAPTKGLKAGDGKYYGYQTPGELAAADWKKAEQWKKEHGGKW